MFVIKKSETYKWPVSVKTPSESAKGGLTEESFTVEFLRIGREKIKDLFSEKASGEAKYTDEEFCRVIVKNISDLKDENGNEVEFSLEVFSSLLDIPGVSVAIMKAFQESISGVKVKN